MEGITSPYDITPAGLCNSMLREMMWTPRLIKVTDTSGMGSKRAQVCEACVWCVLGIRVSLLAELYYVREGVINTYALNFTVPVPANFTYIYFTWKSLIKRPVGAVGRV
ncbi:Tyrosine-protein kinase Drl [Portunus trituberculatus]|uniref:Tyrosine-protein kinase Drl n=1 Tax=Portunus trituberculatus TaxID=210409 RepID=A0A5B7ELY9_PORTR|nr:Tyrosine-protein kinase Drl [Portunus trituberculatus]